MTQHTYVSAFYLRERERDRATKYRYLSHPLPTTHPQPLQLLFIPSHTHPSAHNYSYLSNHAILPISLNTPPTSRPAPPWSLQFPFSPPVPSRPLPFPSPRPRPPAVLVFYSTSYLFTHRSPGGKKGSDCVFSREII